MDDSKTLTLRKANKNDEKLLFNWVNDTSVRRWSFNNKKISLDEHKVWFQQKLADKSVLIWILEVSKMPAGMVRLGKERNHIVLSYLISRQLQGRGLASKMLKMAMNEVKSHWQNIKVFAYSLPENIASIKSLERAGFFLQNSSDEKKCYVFNITESIGTPGE